MRRHNTRTSYSHVRDVDRMVLLLLRCTAAAAAILLQNSTASAVQSVKRVQPQRSEYIVVLILQYVVEN